MTTAMSVAVEMTAENSGLIRVVEQSIARIEDIAKATQSIPEQRVMVLEAKDQITQRLQAIDKELRQTTDQARRIQLLVERDDLSTQLARDEQALQQIRSGAALTIGAGPISPVAALQGELGQISGLLYQFGGSFGGAGAGLSAAAGALQQAGGVLAGGLAVGGAVAAVAAARSAAESYVDWALQVKKLRTEIGGTYEQASKLAGAALLKGIDTSTLEGAFSRLARQLNNLEVAQDSGAKGSGTMRDALKQLHVEADDANGKLRSMYDLLPDIAEGFKNMPDGLQKSALALRLFGGAGQTLVPFLDQGRDGMQALLQKAEDLGLVVDEQGAKMAIAYKGATREVTAELKSIGLVIGQDVLPVFVLLAQSASKTIGGISKDVRTLSEDVKALAGAGKDAGTAFAGIQSVTDVIKTVTDLKNTAEGIVKPIGDIEIAGESVSDIFKTWKADVMDVVSPASILLNVFQQLDDLLRKNSLTAKYFPENQKTVEPILTTAAGIPAPGTQSATSWDQAHLGALQEYKAATEEVTKREAELNKERATGDTYLIQLAQDELKLAQARKAASQAALGGPPGDANQYPTGPYAPQGFGDMADRTKLLLQYETSVKSVAAAQKELRTLESQPYKDAYAIEAAHDAETLALAELRLVTQSLRVNDAMTGASSGVAAFGQQALAAATELHAFGMSLSELADLGSSLSFSFLQSDITTAISHLEEQANIEKDYATRVQAYKDQLATAGAQHAMQKSNQILAAEKSAVQSLEKDIESLLTHSGIADTGMKAKIDQVLGYKDAINETERRALAVVNQGFKAMAPGPAMPPLEIPPEVMAKGLAAIDKYTSDAQKAWEKANPSKTRWVDVLLQQGIIPQSVFDQGEKAIQMYLAQTTSDFDKYGLHAEQFIDKSKVVEEVKKIVQGRAELLKLRNEILHDPAMAGINLSDVDEALGNLTGHRNIPLSSILPKFDSGQLEAQTYNSVKPPVEKGTKAAFSDIKYAEIFIKVVQDAFSQVVNDTTLPESIRTQFAAILNKSLDSKLSLVDTVKLANQMFNGLPEDIRHIILSSVNEAMSGQPIEFNLASSVRIKPVSEDLQTSIYNPLSTLAASIPSATSTVTPTMATAGSELATSVITGFQPPLAKGINKAFTDIDYGSQLEMALSTSLNKANKRLEDAVYDNILLPIGNAMARAGESGGNALVDNIMKGIDARIQAYENNAGRRPS